jgi:hypothetical protein
MTVPLMDRFGRRSLLSSLLLFGGFSCIIAAYIPQGKAKYDYINLNFLQNIIHALYINVSEPLDLRVRLHIQLSNGKFIFISYISL